MGCNAWNHPPGCNCGWGGDTGGGSGETWELMATSQLSATPHISTDLKSEPNQVNGNRANGKIWSTRFSERQPNAQCPVCGELVYFVQIDNGGRVFFDELGPPWTKHPCTDRGKLRVYAPAGYGTSLGKKNHDNWYILHNSIITLEAGLWNIKGYCQELGKHLQLRALQACITTPIPPIMVKEEGDTGIYLCSFITKEALHLSNPSLTATFFPQHPLITEKQWRAALDGEAVSANAIGWAHSFHWDSVPEGAKNKNHRVAEYWFKKASEKGNPIGENNYGVYRLRGYNEASDTRNAWRHLLRAAFQMIPESYGHLGEMLTSGISDFDPTQLGPLLKSIGRHLKFDELRTNDFELNECEEAKPTEIEVTPVFPEYRYSPQEMCKYSYFETALNLSKLTAPLPAWNLVWLSTEGIDDPMIDGDVTQWQNGLSVPHGLLETLLFDLDEDLLNGVTLREALKMHPRQFLDYFEQADTRPLAVDKKNITWKGKVILRARQAAKRIKEVTCDSPHVTHGPAAANRQSATPEFYEHILYAGWIPDRSWDFDQNGAWIRTKIPYWNFIWLMFPDLDCLLSKPRPPEVDLCFLTPIFKYMDQSTLRALNTPPDQFMKQFLADDPDDWVMIQELGNRLPLDYLEVMSRRANEALTRLFPPLGSNVIHANFVRPS